MLDRSLTATILIYERRLPQDRLVLYESSMFSHVRCQVQGAETGDGASSNHVLSLGSAREAVRLSKHQISIEPDSGEIRLWEKCWRTSRDFLARRLSGNMSSGQRDSSGANSV